MLELGSDSYTCRVRTIRTSVCYVRVVAESTVTERQVAAVLIRDSILLFGKQIFF